MAFRYLDADTTQNLNDVVIKAWQGIKPEQVIYSKPLENQMYRFIWIRLLNKVL